MTLHLDQLRTEVQDVCFHPCAVHVVDDTPLADGILDMGHKAENRERIGVERGREVQDNNAIRAVAIVSFVLHAIGTVILSLNFLRSRRPAFIGGFAEGNSVGFPMASGVASKFTVHPAWPKCMHDVSFVMVVAALAYPIGHFTRNFRP